MADTIDTAAGVAAVLGGDAPDPALPLRQSLGGALDANPDQEAKLQAAARSVGVSPLAARYAPEIVRRQAQMQALDLDRLAREFPSTAKLLADQDKARVSHDDVSNLQSVETAVAQAARWVFSAEETGGLARELVGAVRSVASGAPAASSGFYGALAAPFGLADQGLQAIDDLAATLTGTARRQIVGTPGPESFLLDIARGQQRLAADVQGMPADAGWWRKTIGSGLQSAGQSLIGLGLGVGSPSAMLGFMGATQGGESYSRAREAGASPLQAGALGAEDALAEIVTEKFLGAGGLLERMKAGQSAARLFAFELFKEVPGEMAATLWQNFNEWANLHPEKSLGEWLQEQPAALAQTVVATLVGGGVQIGAAKALERAVAPAARQADQAQRAEQTAQALQAMATLAEASKLRERDPATFAAFAQDLADQGVPAVHVEARALVEAGVNLPELAQAMPSVAAQLEQALQTGGDVVIPTGELLAAGATFAQPLIDHLRTAPDAMSKAEADAYMQEHGDQLQAEVERVLGQQQVDDAAAASRDAVRDRYAAELQAAGRTPDVARAEAILLASFYDRTGQRMGGLTAEQVAERYPLRVQRQGAGGDVVMDQPGTPAFDRWFGDSKVVDADGKPLVVYHGTRQKFEAFATNTVGGNYGNEAGFFFTDNRDEADYYTEAEDQDYNMRPGDSPRVIDAFLSLRNPIVFEAEGNATNFIDETKTRQRIEQAKGEGYDGVIVRGDDGDIYVAFRPEQIKSAIGNRGTYDPNSPNILEQSAYHGTPHRGIEKFSTDKIGTGEGAQAYGWGLYFASKREIAEFYRKTLTQGRPQFRDDEASAKFARIVNYADAAADTLVDALRDNPNDAKSAGQSLRRSAKNASKPEYRDAYAALASMVESGEIIAPPPGQLYEVEIPDDEHMLLWDKPLSEQPAAVREALEKLGADDWAFKPYAKRDAAGQEVYRYLAREHGERAASEALAALGIKGIKYLDGTSRGAGDGSFNYVVFSGDDVAIKAQFYQKARGQIAFGQDITRQPSVIALLKGADLSTFIHELGHYFLQVQVDVAARIVAQQRAGASLQPAEQEMVDDARTLLHWMGVQDTPEVSALDQWLTLTPDQQREMHEKFARGFERFAFEGKAPSIELQGVFQRFRAWLVGVYKQLVNLRVDLTDEVRGVMSRMLASEEQIRITEQARSLLPLFTAPDQAGMTPEEWADYQAQGEQATADAIDTLQSRSLRDMQWLRNARGRVLRRLQREADAQRREVRAQARTEVMSQPVYRAWAFLTSKLSADEPSEAETEWRKDVADWKVKRSEAEESAAAAERALVLAANPDVKGLGKGQLLARSKRQIGINVQQRMLEWDREHPQPEKPATPTPVGEAGPMGAGRLDITDLKGLGLPAETLDRLVNAKMTAKTGLHPDVVADLFGFESGDHLAREMAAATPPGEAIDGLTDQHMLERYGDLATPAAIERAADAAVANEARGRMIATEAAALERAIGPREKVGQAGGRSITRSIMPRVAREWADAMIGRLKVRDLRPGRYTAAEARAARNAAKASAGGDLPTAAAEKRNELVQHYAAKQAHEALDEIERGLRYLRKFDSEGTRKALDVDYLDQIDALLERFDLRQASLKAIDKRTALLRWVESQREQGFEPDIPESLLNEARRQNYRDLSVEEFRGLVDGVRQIEHLARLKHKLLTARDQREYEAIRDEIATTIDATAGDREANSRTPTTNLGRVAQGFRRFWAAHIKVATWGHVFDGGRDGGPVWEHIIRPANEAADRETTMRAEATLRLSEILAPVFKLGRMGGAGVYFPGIDRSLNRESRLAIALNTGNAGNLQRLLDGEGWSMQQLQPVLESLTAAEWQAVQQVWDHLETYRPLVAAKERRVYGKEPNWVEPVPFTVRAADGAIVALRGGYYPVKYDPAASQRAEEHADAEQAKREMQGAYTSATTRRSFTKKRAEAVKGRPLLYTLAGLYAGVNDVIHDLTHHEFLIDVNRLLRSTAIDEAIRRHYGPEVKDQFKSWVKDIAEGGRGTDGAVEMAVGRLRHGISSAGLGFNVMSAAIQPLGFSQSISLLGVKWAGRGLARYVAGPRALAREVTGRSEFMANRARTRFRELAELRNRVEGQTTVAELNGRYAYWLMMQAQSTVDLPTWWGAYEKALAAGETEDRAIGMADQAVIDSQGGGQIKDQAAIERGGQLAKLFTVFYTFMNTTLNLATRKAMTADTPAKKAKLAADALLLLVVPGVLTTLLKDALTPGDAGDDDPEKLARKLVSAQLDQLMGLFVIVREFGEVSKIVTGAEGARGYDGPAGVRLIGDALRAGQQVAQGDFDDALRKSLVNLAGDLTGLPAAQVNRTINGAQALDEGKTDNPAALVFGYQEPR